MNCTFKMSRGSLICFAAGLAISLGSAAVGAAKLAGQPQATSAAVQLDKGGQLDKVGQLDKGGQLGAANY